MKALRLEVQTINCDVTPDFERQRLVIFTRSFPADRGMLEGLDWPEGEPGTTRKLYVTLSYEDKEK